MKNIGRLNKEELKQITWTLILLIVLFGLFFTFEKGEELGKLLAYYY